MFTFTHYTFIFNAFHRFLQLIILNTVLENSRRWQKNSIINLVSLPLRSKASRDMSKIFCVFPVNSSMQIFSRCVNIWTKARYFNSQLFRNVTYDKMPISPRNRNSFFIFHALYKYLSQKFTAWILMLLKLFITRKNCFDFISFRTQFSSISISPTQITNKYFIHK